MKTIFVLLAITNFCRAQSDIPSGPQYDGFKIISEVSDGVKSYYVTNQHNTAVCRIDTLAINTNKIISLIKKSTLTDKDIIARVLEMRADSADRMDEIMNLCETYNGIELIVLKEIVTLLGDILSEKQMQVIKQQKQ
ncbi:MAG: hypothetical protein ACHQF2_05995 [Flavobacteriales bacterium]